MCRYVVTMIISLYALVVCPVSAAVPRGVNLAKLAAWHSEDYEIDGRLRAPKSALMTAAICIKIAIEIKRSLQVLNNIFSGELSCVRN